MNIDERLEALTQSVELLTHDVREMQVGIKDLKDAVFALLTIAGNHEKRLQRLEGQNGSKPGEET